MSDLGPFSVGLAICTARQSSQWRMATGRKTHTRTQSGAWPRHALRWTGGWLRWTGGMAEMERRVRPRQRVSPLGRQHKTPIFLISPSLPGPRSLRARKPPGEQQRTSTTSPSTALRARLSSYFPIVGFPCLPCACALFSHPLRPRDKPRHRVASCARPQPLESFAFWP